MTGRDEAVTESQVDALLDRLRDIGAHQDPVPAGVLAAASTALELRDLDSALAALVADSDAVNQDLALVRGPQDVRLLTFEASAVIVDMQVMSAGPMRQLVGHVEGGGEWELTLQHQGGVTPVGRDEHGRFRVDGVRPGHLRLLLRDGTRSVTTTWVTV